MNRREALQKLGTVGVTATAATLIVSSPAFADGGSNNARPTVPGPPTLTNPNIFTGTTQVTFAAAPCPFTAGPLRDTARIDYAIYVVSITSGGSVTPTFGSAATFVNGAAAGNPGGITTPVIDINLPTGGTVVLRHNVRYVCQEPGGAPAWRCLSWNRTYGFNGFFFSVVADWSAGPAPTGCNTGV